MSGIGNQRSLANARRLVVEWNRSHRVGTTVLFERGNGTIGGSYTLGEARERDGVPMVDLPATPFGHSLYTLAPVADHQLDVRRAEIRLPDGRIVSYEALADEKVEGPLFSLCDRIRIELDRLGSDLGLYFRDRVAQIEQIAVLSEPTLQELEKERDEALTKLATAEAELAQYRQEQGEGECLHKVEHETYPAKCARCGLVLS